MNHPWSSSDPSTNAALARALTAFPDAKATGKGFVARCPAHEDDRPSLSIGAGRDGRVVLHCFAGCPVEAVVSAAGLTMAELYPPRRNGDREEPEKSYRYVDEKGELLYETVRFPGKRFMQRRPDSEGRWQWNLEGVRRVLYRLPDLLRAEETGPIWIVEGEKDADRLAAAGLTATTAPMGAGKWRQEYTQWLKVHRPRARLLVVGDNDEPGRRHAQEVVASLMSAGLSARPIELPGLGPKEDVSDWLDRGGTLPELLELAKPPVRFRLYTLDELLAAPLPAWQVEEIWEQGGVVMVFGEGGCGKTFWIVDVCMHLCCALPWRGHEVAGGPVVYVNADGGMPFRMRPQAWRFENPDVEMLYPFLVYNDRLDLRERGMFEAFVDDVQQQAGKPAIVVFDTFHRVMPGADENDARDTSRFFDSLSGVRRDLGATSLFVHHSNKADTGHRGHSSLRDDSDTAIEVRREEGGLRMVRCDKQRNRAEFPDFFFRLRSALSGETCVLESVDGPAGFVASGGRGARGRTEASDRMEEILAAIVAAGEITQTDLAAATGLSVSQVNYYCRRLMAGGRVRSREGLANGPGRRPILYSVRGS